jgi:AraC-like DNA-binding protein
MSIYFFFAIPLLSIFSILENLKIRNKISLIKAHLLLVLLFVAVNSILLFFNELLFVELERYISLLHIVITILVYNILYLLTNHKFKDLFIIQCVLLLIYAFIIFNETKLIYPLNESFKDPLNSLIYFNLFFRGLGISIIIRNLIIKDKNQNFKNANSTVLIKYKMHILLFAIIIFMPLIVYALILVGLRPDYRILLIVMYSGIILFSLYRPLIFDNFNLASIDLLKQEDSVQTNYLEIIESEFYTNKYYLNPDAKIQDFSNQINASHFEIQEFVKMQKLSSFTDLLNKSRIDHFIILLNDSLSKSYTIEALSLMSGFKNRRTMYLYFKKFYNVTPTDYLNNQNNS